MSDETPTGTETPGTEQAAGVSIEINDDGPCRKRMKFVVSAERMSDELDSNYRQLRGTIQLPGFRKGKVPLSIIKGRFGSKIAEDVKEEMVNSSFFDAILEQQTRLEPIAVGEQQNDDFAVCHVSIVDSEGNSVFDRDEVHLKIGLDSVDNIEVPGLGEALIGASAEETREFAIDAPEDFPVEAVQGHSVTLRIRFLEAKRAVKPELNEETLGQLGVESEDALRSEIEKSLENRRRIEEETRQESELVDAMLESMELEFPPSILERRTEELSMSARFRMMREGKDKDETEAEVAANRAEFEKESRAELTRYFVLDAIADKEQVFVTEDEVARRLTAIAMTTGRQPQEVAEEYRENGMLDELRGGIRREKVRAVIRKKAKVNQPAGAEETASEEADGDQD